MNYTKESSHFTLLKLKSKQDFSSIYNIKIVKPRIISEVRLLNKTVGRHTKIINLIFDIIIFLFVV